MATITIADLPEELLESILRNVAESISTAQFWTYLNACRQWHRIGLAIYGRLDYSTSAIIECQTRRQQLKEEDVGTSIRISTDLILNGPSRLFLQELRSLTIHVRHIRIASPFKAAPGRDFFEALADSFVLIRKLSTFSLKFAADGWDLPSVDVPAVPQSHLARLVASLPDTITNLEIDTAGADLPPSEELKTKFPERHFCYQVSRILCRLRHLRLRTEHVCQRLVDSAPIVQCSCESNHSICSSIGKTHCRVARSWNMQQLSIWLPWGHYEEDSSLAIALRRITKLSPFPPLTTIICQNHSRAHYMGLVLGPGGDFYPDFVWEAKANTGDNGDLLVRRASVFVKDNQRRGSCENSTSCREHSLLTSAPRRYFQLGSEYYPQSRFGYIAEWYLEDDRRWAQDGHGDCRYPVSEAKDSAGPFWKAAHEVPPASATGQEHGAGLHHCLFPHCRSRFESISHLRGHMMYAHPSHPHDGTWEGVLPCPSVGCPHVGSLGFYKKQHLEEHLLSHHVNVCHPG